MTELNGIETLTYQKATAQQQNAASVLVDTLLAKDPTATQYPDESHFIFEASPNLLLVEDGRVCATGVLELRPSGNARIRYLIVDEQERGRKFGEQMLVGLEHMALDLTEGPDITLELTAQDSAVGFYRKYDYETVPGSDVRMQKVLSRP